MPRVRIISDPFDLATYKEHVCENVIDLLQEQFATWPETGRIYKDTISEDRDVTPVCEEQINDLQNAGSGDLFYVVVYPGDPVTAIIAVVATLVLTAAVLLFLTPKIPNVPTQEQASANNTLGQRANKPRPNGRIEDIFGEVISVPTLLTVPLLVFDNNLEVEYCYMSVGRGSYQVSDVKDGDTPIGQIAGAGVRFYGPNTSPNSGTPFFSTGAPITQPLVEVIKANEVNGQSLRSPNANSVQGKSDIRFKAPDTIERQGTVVDFTKFFQAGDSIVVDNANFGGNVSVFDATTQNARFYPDYRIEFQTFDPTTLYKAGQTLVISNAGFAGPGTTSGSIVYTDVSGTYVISSVDGPTKTIRLVAP